MAFYYTYVLPNTIYTNMTTCQHKAQCNCCKLTELSILDEDVGNILICKSCYDANKIEIDSMAFECIVPNLSAIITANKPYLAFGNVKNKELLNHWIANKATGNSRIEKPCRRCSRKNDLGVRVCWSCGAENPV